MHFSYTTNRHWSKRITSMQLPKTYVAVIEQYDELFDFVRLYEQNLKTNLPSKFKPTPEVHKETNSYFPVTRTVRIRTEHHKVRAL